MKRSRLSRGTPMRSDPQKTRDWQNRSRKRLRPKQSISAEQRANGKASRPLRHSRSEKKRKGQAWSLAVKERDGWRCQWPKGCTTGDDRIDAHHIAERSLRPDLRFDVNNGIALCRTHHDWIPLHRKEAIRLGLLSEATYEAAQKAKR